MPKSKERPPRSQRELDHAMIHIGYEVRMCAQATARCVALELDGSDELARNAFLESALLHARGLYEFLTTARAKGDDLLRDEFGPPWLPADGEQELARGRLELLQPDLHKHLAHLTWRRVDDPSVPGWTLIEIARDVVTLARGWADHLMATADLRNEPVGLLDDLDEAERVLGLLGPDGSTTQAESTTSITTASGIRRL